VGHGFTEIATIREYLALDSGLMSRLVRGLEEEGLVQTMHHPEDARRRLIKLTSRGENEFKAYEELSNNQAARMLAGHRRRKELLQAMDLIASYLGKDRILLEEVDPRSEVAKGCLSQYYAELAQRFSQGFEVAKSRDPEAGQMVPPRGTFLLAVSDGLPVGCVGLKGSGDKTGEIKRLWIAPHARGLGIAQQLMTAAEGRAVDLDMDVLRLDTNSALPEARRLYERLGWIEIPRFNDDPYPDLFFEKNISRPDHRAQQD
jgi:DNA-binding MarR family transcriptional regulator/GNAT superfamily N-acetyltransferase